MFYRRVAQVAPRLLSARPVSSQQLSKFSCFSRIPASSRIGDSFLKSNAQRCFSNVASSKIRNVAIAAHVDHGKSTLVDALLQTAGTGQLNERVMDSNELEKERGITILSKVTSMVYKGHHLNIVDTPGHSDFSGEVERVLSMVDSICLLVCGTDGPMPQTKYVLKKALALDLKPIVVINKIDRPTARVEDVEIEVMELFDELAPGKDIEYETIYAVGKNGWASKTVPEDTESVDPDMTPLLDTMIQEIPPPVQSDAKEFGLLVTIMESDPSVHLGKLLLTGRVHSGVCRPGMDVKVLNPDGELVPGDSSVIKMFKREGMTRVEVNEAVVGDIVTISGVNGRVGDTICEPELVSAGPIDGPVLDPPTISMYFSLNDSPLCGNPEHSGGTKLTTQMIRDRLFKETQSNIAVQIGSESANVDGRECVEVHGRGEMQLGILIENMRREGYELSVSPPRALMKTEDGVLKEPFEEVEIDCPDQLTGTVMEMLHPRKAELFDSLLDESATRRTLKCHIPSRGMVGLRGALVQACRGDVIVNALFHGYFPHCGQIFQTRKGALVATQKGTSTTYALNQLESRGHLFIGSHEEVYPGMIVGEHSRDTDLEINVCKTKKLTNVRAAGKDEFVKLLTPRKFMLEDMIAYVEPDEVVEITPVKLRMRKSILDPSQRKAAGRKKSSR